MIVINLIFHCLFVEIKYRFELDKCPSSGGKKKLIIKELLSNIINHSDIVQFSKNQQKHLHADETSSILPFSCWLPVYELDSFFLPFLFSFWVKLQLLNSISRPVSLLVFLCHLEA